MTQGMTALASPLVTKLMDVNVVLLGEHWIHIHRHDRLGWSGEGGRGGSWAGQKLGGSRGFREGCPSAGVAFVVGVSEAEQGSRHLGRTRCTR
jgi:hypothetical protein